MDRGREGDQRNIPAEDIVLGPVPYCKIPSEGQGWAGELREVLWCSEEYIWSLSLVPGRKLQNQLDSTKP